MTISTQLAGVVIQLLGTVILARLLSPDDYGIIAMVLVVTNFAGLFRDLGLSAVTVQKPDITPAQLSGLFWMQVGMGGLLTGLTIAVSPAVAWFYGQPEITPVMMALAPTFLIASFGSQSSALLQRRLAFGRIASATITSSLVGLAVAVIGASTGLRYWALVWSAVATGVSSTLLLFILAGWRPQFRVRGAGIRALLRSGLNITGFDLFNFFHRNLDNILIGRVSGAVALGLYSRAYSLMMFPVQNLRGPINAVAFPNLAGLQHDPAAFRGYFCQMTSLLAFASMPLTALLFLAAEPVIRLTLGEAWMPVVPIFSLLAIVAFVQPVFTLFGLVCLSTGRTRRYFWLGVFNTICTGIGFGAGVHHGPVGVAAGYAAATYLSAWPLLHWTFRGTPVRVMDFFRAIVRPALAALIGAVAVRYLIMPQIAEFSSVLQITTTAVAMLACYCAVLATTRAGRSDLTRVARLRHHFQALAA